MPFNIFAEEFRHDCGCGDCVRARDNVGVTNGLTYASRREAVVAYRNEIAGLGGNWSDRNGTEVTYDTVLERYSHPQRRHHLRDFFQEDREAYLRERERQRQGAQLAEQVRRAGLTTEQRQLEDLRRRGDPRFNYSHKPRWHFFGSGPLFIGPELEVTCRDFGVMQLVTERLGDTGFLKRDSSVAGFELVMHPMDFTWAMQNFPWKLLDDMARLECTIDASNNGLHMHVSRAGFSSPAHQLRWLKFIYRNKDQVSRLARRRSRYGTFKEAAQAGQYTHIQIAKAKAAYREIANKYSRTLLVSDEQELEEAVRRLDRISRGDATILERYAAINTQNEATFEMRMFAASLGTFEIKAAFQFASASVEYTRNITAHDVCKGGWGWLAFSGWLRDHEGTYPELVRANRFARVTKGESAKYSLAAKPRAGM